MAVIGFSGKPDEIWNAAGWAFRQILDDVITQHSDDDEMVRELVEANATKGLNIDLLDRDFASRVTNAIRDTATDILSGSLRSGIHEKSYGDTKTVEQYLEALRELLKTIPSDVSDRAY
jgi:hypothetical protein